MKVITMFLSENDDDYSYLNKGEDLYCVARRQLNPKGPDCVDIFVDKNDVDNMINILNVSEYEESN